MTLSKAEISQIKLFMKEDGFEVLLRILAQHIDEINATKVTGQNAFETLRELHIREGKVEGLTEFFDRLERNAFE